MTEDRDEVYPRAPLVEVVFELRFPGEPAIECHRDEVFQFVRESMPLVKVPEASSPENFKFRTYQYTSEDNSLTVMSGLNLLSFSNKRYTGFANFKKQLIPVFKFVIERFKLKALRRFGFRYINAIPFTREGGAMPIGKFFQSKFDLSPKMPGKMEQCAVAVVQKLDAGKVIARIEGMKRSSGEEAFLLDLDYFRNEGLEISRFEDYLEEGHGGAKGFFENIITDQYRNFLRGKPLL